MAHFYERVPEQLRNTSNQKAVEEYVARSCIPGQAIEGLTGEQLREHPVPGTWSIQQILLHWMDTDLVASYRMKRIIAEDHPRLDCYDETAFADRLRYDRLDAALACEVFRMNRELTASILRARSDEAFLRTALHPEIGEITLGQLVRLYCYHVDHHLVFLREKRLLIENK